MLKLSDFFAPLGISNILILFVFIACCEIIGFSLAKTFIKKIPDFLRGAVWLLGLGLIIFLYFLSHFFIPLVWPAIGICLAISLFPSLPTYLKAKGWQSLIGFLKENYLPLLLLLPVFPLIFIKVSLPPYIWDEMAYHYISPYFIYFEKVWRLGSGVVENYPRFLETAFIAIFSLTKTYATARLLHFTIFISVLITIYQFLKDKFGRISALIFFLLLAYHGENLLFRATSGYIDVGTASLVTIGIICLVCFFLEGKFEVLLFGAAFWGMAVGAKYSSLTPLLVFSLLTIFLLWKRRLIRSNFKRYFLAFLIFMVMGGYWYLKNFLHTGNPIYPLLNSFFGCRFSNCPAPDYKSWTVPISLSSLKGIISTVLGENVQLKWIFPIALFLSSIHANTKVRKVSFLLLLFIFLEILINSINIGYEQRFFYHWQFLAILLIVLPTTSIAKWIKTPKKALYVFPGFLNFELRIGKNNKVWRLETSLAEIFLRVCFFSFLPLWALAFLFSLIESFTYSNFLPGTRFLFFLCVLSGILTRFFPQKKFFTKKWTHGYKYFFVVNKFIFPLILAFTAVILIFEKIHYPNYIFSLIHLQPRLLFWPCFLSGFAVFLGISDPDGRWFLISNKKFYFKVCNSLFTILLLIFATYFAFDLIKRLYKTEAEPERKIEVQYATREINIYQWIETLFPKMKEVIYWCEKNPQSEDLISFDPALIWTSYQGLFRVYMTNCHLQYIVTREGAEDFLQGEKTFKWLASLNDCDSKMISPKEDKSIDDSEYLKTVNNYFVCQAKPLLPGLFVLENNKR